MDSFLDPGKVLLIDKALEWTSFDVVKKIRGQLKIKKIGHAGTLDPLASGLLIVCTGKKTKSINDFMELEKEYSGSIVIGKTTPSYDLETEFDSTTDHSHITESDCLQASESLTGELLQIPPAHSAVKIGGKRAYQLARAGKKVEIKAKPVTIHTFQIDTSSLPVVKFKVICSKGTYIRSLARDFGEILGTGAYLSSLRRNRIGDFHVDEAMEIQALIQNLKTKTGNESS